MANLLIVTEKPSVAKSIASALGVKENEKHEGYIEGFSDYFGIKVWVTWCLGHLVQMSYPEAYDPKYAKWRLEDLPILPEEFRYEVIPETKKQFRIVTELMNSVGESEQDKREKSTLSQGNKFLVPVDAIVCATDAGREGELIFRLVYEQARCSKPIKRLWISSMEESAIRDGFDHLRPGAEYDNLYASALCRQQADWLVGLNGTRLFTVLYRSKVLKVGRVQTPTLAMLVDREAAIQSFKKTPFYTVHLIGAGMDAVSEKYPDKARADSVADSCKEHQATVKSVVSEDKSVAAPRLYDLTTLQRDANRIFGFTAKKTLEYTQSLYEKKLCTYPRTDSQYLSDDMEDTARNVLSVVQSTFPYLQDERPVSVDFKRVMNSKKVSDHHAIIPTVQIETYHNVQLSDGELKILALISTRLCMATAEKYQYRSIKAELECGDNICTASGTTVVEPGWKKYDAALRSEYKVRMEKEDEELKSLPPLTEGFMYSPSECKVVEGFTQPPKHFTEDSLLSAMERAGAEDMGDDVERKGLGTPATRADIIEKLVKDGFVKREKKQMIPTDDGMKLITVLPDVIKSPKLTADWENALTLVAKGEYSAEQFMNGIRNMVTDLVKTYNGVGEENRNMFGSNDALGKCPKCGGDVIRGKYGLYCSEKCGMNIGRAFGKELSEEQVKDLLEGKKIFVEGLKSKKGGIYNAYLIPDGVREYSYIKKDGSQATGYEFNFKMEFPKKEEK